MNDQFDETQLSAYLDGELTPEERERVENWLNESGSARRTLERLQAVSTCLTQLPVSPAPDGFSEAVLAASDSDRVTVRPATSPGRRLVLAATGVAAALAVALAIGTWPGSSSDEPAIGTLASATASPSSETSELQLHTEPGSQALMAPAENGQKFVFNNTLDKAQVGQVISAMETSGDQAVVVKLTVVDVEQGLDQLRLLLQQHEIPRADASPSSDKVGFGQARVERARGGPGAAGLGSADGLVSVVVKASPGQMSEALAQFRREVVRELEIAGSVQVATLQQSPDGRRAFDALASYGRGPQKALARSAVRRQPIAPPAPTTAGKRDRAAATADAAPVVTPGGSAQVSIVLPNELLTRIRKSKEVAREKETDSDGRVLRRRESGQQPLLVVFMLVAEPRPSPARTKTGPDGAA